MNQILLTLRYYATGNHLLSIADFAGSHVSTVSRVVLRVSTAIANHMRTFVKFPDSSEEIQKAKAKFYKIASFPGVIGAIDGTHVKIQAPGTNRKQIFNFNNAEIFRNRKGYFSINVQAVCNSELEVLDLVARWPGSTHDATVFGNSRVKSCFENNLYPDCILLGKHYSLDRVLILIISHKNISGDSGYAIKPYLMTPLANPTTPGEKLYNESHIRTRNIIERMFGVWKRRFPVLAYGCRLKLSTTLIVIVATCVLHNIARQMGMADPSGSDDFEDTELFNAIKAGEMFERDTHTQSNNASNNAGMMRRRHLLAEHFSRL